MANYRPKSLSELNNVYDKAMRAEKAIKEGSGLLSATENETTPQNENIFLQLETKAAEADKNRVFDPDITNIANDFLKRYAQPEKPKAVPKKEIKRPAPSIQSVYHTPVKPKHEDKQEIPSNSEIPSVPLHKPAATIPAAQPEPETKSEAKEADETLTAKAAEAVPVQSETPTEPKAPTVVQAQATPVKAKPSSYKPPVNSPSRVRITSTERSELMEEYLRVMSDDDDEPSYKKPLFSFFKKRRKYEDEDYSEDLYEELPDEAEEYAEEPPVVQFDSSDVKYDDEYSDAPAEDSQTADEENMGFNDYIEADFDYDDEEEDDTLDVSTSFPKASQQIEYQELSEEEPDQTDEAEAIIDEPSDESEPEALAEDTCEDTAEEEAPEDIQDSSAEPETQDEEYSDTPEETEEAAIEPTEEVIYPTEEAEDDSSYESSPVSDMVFEDIFSVTDESKRSHTGGNWEEVFGENFAADNTDEAEPEVIIPEEIEDEQEAVKEEAPSESSAEYPSYEEETQQYEDEDDEDFEEESEVKKKPKGFLRFLMIFFSVICIISTAVTILVSTLGVDSGKLFADKFRAFSVPGNLTEIGLAKDDLVITENAYAHTDDLYVYTEDSGKTFNFGKITAGSTNPLGDYLYVTQTNNGVVIVNRDHSMGVVVATYSNIGRILSVICEYYIFMAGAFILLAVAMIVCLVLMKKRDSDADNTSVFVYEPDHPQENSNEEEYEDNYYDYDTDGIEQGLFTDI